MRNKDSATVVNLPWQWLFIYQTIQALKSHFEVKVSAVNQSMLWQFNYSVEPSVDAINAMTVSQFGEVSIEVHVLCFWRVLRKISTLKDAPTSTFSVTKWDGLVKAMLHCWFRWLLKLFCGHFYCNIPERNISILPPEINKSHETHDWDTLTWTSTAERFYTLW